MTTNAKVVVGLVAGALVGIGAFLIGKNASSSSSSTTTGPVTSLTAGHRYRVTMTAPGASVFPAQTSAGLAGFILTHYPTMKFVTLDQASPTQVVFTIDATADVPGPIVFQTGAGMTIADMGQAPASSSGPLPANATWQRITTAINPGATIRGSISEATFATIANALGVPSTFSGFQQWLSSPSVAANFSTASVAAWGANQTLPLDWPLDDPSPTTEYHFQFTYGGAAPLPLSSFPFPGTLWQKI